MSRAALYEELRRSAFDWIKAAGVIARERFGHATVSRKADHSPVTDADHAVQAALLHAIADRYPGDGVIAEEVMVDPQRHEHLARAKRCWVVDPIDGTRNYARGYPSFSVSVGMMADGIPVVGWVYNPLTGEMYSAAKGVGAFRNEVRLSVRDEGLGGEVLIALPSSRRRGYPTIVQAWIDRMVSRSSGSTALNLAHLASGAVNAMYCDHCRLWDIAAGVLLVTEAGGRIISPEGESYFPLDLASYNDEPMPFLAAGPQTLEELFGEFRAAGSR